MPRHFNTEEAGPQRAGARSTEQVANDSNVFQMADYRPGCVVCGRIRCEGDCPVSDVRTVTLVCDLCGNQVRILPFDQCYAMFMTEWQQTHAVHHVYLDPPGTLGPPVTDCRWAPVEPCKKVKGHGDD